MDVKVESGMGIKVSTKDTIGSEIKQEIEQMEEGEVKNMDEMEYKASFLFPDVEVDFKVQEDDGVPFECSKCDFKTKHRTSLIRHVKTVHEDQGIRHSCEECEFEAKSKWELTRHISIKHNGFKVVCDRCEYTTSKQSQLVQHIESVHEGKTYDCDQCDFITKVKKFLKQHIATVHEGLTYNCKECDYKSVKRLHLKNHVDVVHKGIQYKCSKCDYVNNKKVNLANHIASVHDNVRYPCKLCDHKALTKSYLKRHVRGVHEGAVDALRKLYCKQCKFRTGFEFRLKKHVETVHGGDALFCEKSGDFKIGHKTKPKEHVKTLDKGATLFCEKSGNFTSKLKKHIDKIHEDIVYSCEQCDHKFNSKKALNIHLGLVHKDGREEICELCGFKGLKNLVTKHKKNNHEENNAEFLCHICEYFTPFLSNLKRHVETIHGTKEITYKYKRYKCKLCNHKPNSISKLEEHMETVHNMEYSSDRSHTNTISPHTIDENVVSSSVVSQDNLVSPMQTVQAMYNLGNCANYLGNYPRKVAEGVGNASNLGFQKSIHHEYENAEQSRQPIFEHDTFYGIDSHSQTKAVNFNIKDKGIHGDFRVKQENEDTGVKRDINCNLCNYKGVNIRNLEEHIKYVHKDYIQPSLVSENELAHKVKFETNSDFGSSEVIAQNAVKQSDQEVADVEGLDEDTEELFDYKIKCEAINDSFDLGRSFECNQCDFIGNTEYELSEHTEASHDRVKYKCKECDQLLVSMEGLSRHVETIHKGIKTKRYKCRLCNHKPNSIYKLQEHMESVHNIKSTTDNSETLDHKIKSTTNESDTSIVRATPVKTEKDTAEVHVDFNSEQSEVALYPNTCQVCHKSFKCPSALDKHMMKHTGKKPFACTECSKTVQTLNSLKAHMRIHTGEKPFYCGTCKKSYRLKNALQYHCNITKHIFPEEFQQPVKREGKTFLCNLCPKSFALSCNLKMHLTH